MADKITTTNSFGPSGSGFMSEGLTIETDFTTDESVALSEVQENEYSGLCAFIKERFARSKDKRLSDETRWLESYRNYRGIYGPDVQFTDTEKSKAFIKITKTKVHAAYAQIVDILLAGNKFPIGVEASPLPEGISESVHVDPKEPEGLASSTSTLARPDISSLLGPVSEKLDPVKDKLKEGPGVTNTSFTWEPAKIAAKKMEKKLQDQLLEANADKSLRSFVFEMALFGTGVYKGPLIRDKEYPKWSADGEYTPVIKPIADMEFVSCWDAYPDPEAMNMTECEYFIQRHRMSKTQLRSLKNRPAFLEDKIEKAIEDGYNFVPEYWESTLKDYEVTASSERFEVFEYWGTADKDFEEITELDIPKQFKDKDQVQVNIWICNDQILRVVFNPLKPMRIPFHACPYELNPYSFFGIGIAENMTDTQLLMNGFMRMAVDNGVLSGNIILEVNENNLVPGQDMKLYPGKIFRTQGSQGQSIWATKIDNKSQENLMMFDKARQLADEATGMPSYAHGQGGIQGIGRTASGMSMLMGAAAQNVKAVVRNIDDYLLVPLGKDLFAFNMQFDFDKDFIGDLEVVAQGTQSLMRNEVRSQKVLQFLQVTNNPVDGPWVKRDYLLRELAESLDLEADKSVNDPREAGLQAMLMQEMMKAQGIDPNQGGGSQGQSPSVPGTDAGSNPGSAPVPQEQGFSGSGGGSNIGTGEKPPQGNGQ